MSIVSQTPSLHPDTFFDGLELEGIDRKWWVLYTKARQEKAVARELFAHDVPFYLPLVRKTLVYGNRRVHSRVPIFSGYVFLRGSEEERVQALRTNRICRVLPVADPQRLREDLEQLRRLIESGAPLTVEARLARGARVRIRRGPLAGLEGTVLVRRGITRVLVCVDFLQRGASVAIDDCMLEPLG